MRKKIGRPRLPKKQKLVRLDVYVPRSERAFWKDEARAKKMPLARLLAHVLTAAAEARRATRAAAAASEGPVPAPSNQAPFGP